MPWKALKSCKHPGCPNLTDGLYCAEHQPLHPDRPSAAKRGYGSKWQRLSKAYLPEASAVREVYGTGTVHSSNCGRPYHSSPW